VSKSRETNTFGNLSVAESRKTREMQREKVPRMSISPRGDLRSLRTMDDAAADRPQRAMQQCQSRFPLLRSYIFSFLFLRHVCF
jgi:hypothetical protein